MSGISLCRFSGGGGGGAGGCGSQWSRLHCRVVLVQVPSPPAPHPRPLPFITICAWLLPLFLCPVPHLYLTVDFLRGCLMWGGRLRLFVRGLGGRLLVASFVSRVACSRPEGVTQAFRCGAGSCHDIMRPTGRLLTVSLLLCCSALMFLCFSSWFLELDWVWLLSTGAAGGEMRMALICEGGRGGCGGSYSVCLGQGIVGWRPSGAG